ncbi:MAG TPA: hypothetical protein VIL46_05865 [Gemmataceae bacterium]
MKIKVAGETREKLLAHTREAIECYPDRPEVEPVPANARVEEIEV